jgi:hypothetical protein
MEQGILYQPQQLRTFPLVSIYWKNDDNELCAVQTTRESLHAKEISTYDDLFNLLGCAIRTTRLNLYILILPSQLDTCTSTCIGKVWKNTALTISPDYYQTNIQFHVLVPPDNFTANST